MRLKSLSFYIINLKSVNWESGIINGKFIIPDSKILDSQSELPISGK
jgi:hypothetical protein